MDPSSSYDVLLKVVVVGESGVGKSSLIRACQGGEWVASHRHTIGVDFIVESMEVNGKIAKMMVWDTAGQEKFKSLRSSYYRGAHVAIVVFDLSNKRSFDNLPYWLSEVRTHADTPEIILIGNKSDLIPQRAVSSKQLSTYGNDIQIIEASARTDFNVREAFLRAAQLGLQKYVDAKAKKASAITAACLAKRPQGGYLQQQERKGVSTCFSSLIKPFKNKKKQI